MPVRSHQTVRLSAGMHAGPDDGACVMELASMLAGERFSDQPECCCPVIAGFLRTYNDLVDDARREDLYRYAALVVGSRTDPDVEQVRAAMCVRWARSRHLEWHRRGLRRLWPFGGQFARMYDGPVGAAIVAARVAAQLAEAGADDDHREALAFVDRLLATTDVQTASAVRPEAMDDPTESRSADRPSAPDSVARAAQVRRHA